MNLKSRASISPVTFSVVMLWSDSSDANSPGRDSTLVANTEMVVAKVHTKQLIFCKKVIVC